MRSDRFCSMEFIQRTSHVQARASQRFGMTNFLQHLFTVTKITCALPALHCLIICCCGDRILKNARACIHYLHRHRYLHSVSHGRHSLRDSAHSRLSPYQHCQHIKPSAHDHVYKYLPESQQVCMFPSYCGIEYRALRPSESDCSDTCAHPHSMVPSKQRARL